MQETIFKEQPSEQKRFTITYVHGASTEFVEVHTIDMDGWTLYECFHLPSYKVHYFGWDENAGSLEWINLENEEATDEIKVLCSELIKYKQSAA